MGWGEVLFLNSYKFIIDGFHWNILNLAEKGHSIPKCKRVEKMISLNILKEKQGKIILNLDYRDGDQNLIEKLS